MPRILPALPCTPEQREMLTSLTRGRKVEARLKERARIILWGIDGVGVKDTAKEMGINKDTVSLWRCRFLTAGVAGLHDRPRSGAPRKHGPELRERILAQLELAPPEGFGHWDGPLLASTLGVAAWRVWEILRIEGICLARRRSWCVSRDPDFAAKAADVVALYLSPPENAIVFSVDEKPSIQAITRPTGFVAAGKKVVQGDKSTYKRNGTTTLFAALEVATGKVIGKTNKTKTRKDFLVFMDEVVAFAANDKVLHVVMDNLSTHKNCDEWLEQHPNVKFHYTPTSASWLNQVEIWFGIFTRKSLKGASFASVDALVEHIAAYLTAYNQNPVPFVWKKREVRGKQLRNTARNLAN